MIHVIAELRSYRQLARLRSATLPGVEAGLAAALGGGAAGPGPGIWLADIGEADSLDAASGALAASRARDFLVSRRTELFGFAVVVTDLPRPVSTEVVRGILVNAVEDEQLWVAPSCAALFSSVFILEDEAPGRGLRKVAGRRQDAARELPRQSTRSWTREGLAARALDMLSPRSSMVGSHESGPREVLLVHGPAGVGKTALLREVSARLCGTGPGGNVPVGAGPGTLGPGVPVLRLRTIFRRRSPLHPFLGSLDPALLAAVPRHLRGVERAVWADVGGLLTWLREAGGQEPSPGQDPLPDHVLEDFGIGYGLYLASWARAAEEALRPAVLLCDGIDSYHPAARRLLGRVLADLLAEPAFIPLLSASGGDVLSELAALQVRTLFVHPLGKREVMSLARTIFPGLELSASTARRLRRRSGGLAVSVVSALHYLRIRGQVSRSGGAWTFDPAAAAAFPSSHLSVSWFLVRTLPEEALALLYGLFLSGGLLDRPGVLAFLAEAGHDPAFVARSIAGFAALGLMEDEESLIPRYPALRRKLEEVLGTEAAALRDRLVGHLVELWSSGKYRHPVLLYTFLARGGRTDLSLRILPDIIRRKLDENDPAGARVFCDTRMLEFSVPPAPEQARELSAVGAIGRLRAALMEDDPVAAEAAETDLRKLASPETGGDLRAEGHMERSKLFLLRGEALAGLEELKQALLHFQGGREGPADRGGASPRRDSHPQKDRGERACYLWLGAAMLGEGRVGEAVEYLALSQRLCHEAGDAPGTLWTAVYLADCHFIEGRYTRCLSVLDQGLETARILYRRDVELFLLFLKARALFQVGSYEECSLLLQGCMCAATLYGVETAKPVLRAWLGRTLVHGGEIAAGTRLLESLEPSREVLIFLAEGALFAETLEDAVRHVQKGLSLPLPDGFAPPEAMCWRDGFAGVEGRCFRLSRGDALVQRTLSSLSAYLKGLGGSPAEGIQELHQLTRGEKALEVDPSAYWHHYLYSRVLPETGEDVDDRGTIFGKALKSLQERASRIDGPAQRSSFLWRSRWNRMIMEEARERKLL
jgi:tetratricopeptide (TPR) repeat protein